MKAKNTEAAIFGIYCAALLIQNILALKTFDFASFTMTTGVLVSPLVFIAQDVETEIYGFKRAKTMILLAFFIMAWFTILVSITIMITPSSTYANQSAFQAIFSTTWRINLASFAAYCIGSLTNSKVMTLNKENKKLFSRAILSTIAGQMLDNVIFVFGAFAGVLPFTAIISMIAGMTLFEVAYEIILFPVTKSIIMRIGGEKHGNY